MSSWYLYKTEKPAPDLLIELVSFRLGFLEYSYGPASDFADDSTVAWRYYNSKETQEYSDIRGRASAVLRAGGKGIRPMFQLPGIERDLITGFMLGKSGVIPKIVNSPALRGGGNLEPETIVFVALFYDALMVQDYFDDTPLSPETETLLRRRNTIKLLDWIGPSWKEYWRTVHSLSLDPYQLISRTMFTIEKLSATIPNE